MNWLIDYTDDAIKALAKLDKPTLKKLQVPLKSISSTLKPIAGKITNLLLIC